jgi:prophage antirepressor-like protein
MNCIEKVGTIRFDNHCLDVYDSLDEPLFLAVDVAKLIDYSVGNTSKMLDVCEKDEIILVPVLRPYGNTSMRQRLSYCLTELGLYNILSQSRKPIARRWRRVVHDELINMRRSKSMDILSQFNEWDSRLDDLFIDEETGKIMQSVTVQGGDVIQVPFED